MSGDDAQSELTETFYERLAKTTWGAYLSGVEMRAVLKAHELSGMPGTALEIGADGGRWSKLLADRGWNMICTEVDAVTLATCQRRVPTARCIHVGLDDDTLPQEADSVDLLLCIEVPTVLEADWFVSEASRVLKRDGLVVSVFWNRNSIRGLFYCAKTLFGRGIRGLYSRSYSLWRRELLNSGYAIVHEEGYCWLPFSRSSNSRLVPGLTRLEKWLGLRRLPSISPWVAFIAQKS